MSWEIDPALYEELRRMAATYMRRERTAHTLQTTALVHEAYLRLVGHGPVEWNSRGHFFAAAAEAMRRILIERARQRGQAKRGGDRARIPLSVAQVASDEHAVDMLALDEALGRMKKEHERMSQVVMLRFFAGLSVDDTAQALGISDMTVKRDWTCARAWLYDELYGDEASLSAKR